MRSAMSLRWGSNLAARAGGRCSPHERAEKVDHWCDRASGRQAPRCGWTARSDVEPSGALSLHHRRSRERRAAPTHGGIAVGAMLRSEQRPCRHYSSVQEGLVDGLQLTGKAPWGQTSCAPFYECYYLTDGGIPEA